MKTYLTVETRNLKRLVLGLMLITMATLTMGFSIKLRNDADKIRETMLLEYPIGTKIEAIEAALRAQKIEITVNVRTGFLKQEPRKPTTVVGKKSIEAKMGDYWSFPFFRTTVVCFFGFDEAGSLIDIWVWKTVDGA